MRRAARQRDRPLAGIPVGLTHIAAGGRCSASVPGRTSRLRPLRAGFLVGSSEPPPHSRDRPVPTKLLRTPPIGPGNFSKSSRAGASPSLVFVIIIAAIAAPSTRSSRRGAAMIRTRAATAFRTRRGVRDRPGAIHRAVLRPRDQGRAHPLRAGFRADARQCRLCRADRLRRRAALSAKGGRIAICPIWGRPPIATAGPALATLTRASWEGTATVTVPFFSGGNRPGRSRGRRARPRPRRRSRRVAVALPASRGRRPPRWRR